MQQDSQTVFNAKPLATYPSIMISRPLMLFTLICAAVGLAAGGARAQVTPASSAALRADSLRRDSLAAQALARVHVTVTRVDAATTTAPWAIGVADKGDLQRGQATLGIGEALPAIPGVYVANRYNYALDQRLSIRGAGSRANFGLRGVKVLLDGVPQSLPDGQSQLTNVDLGAISRVEVLRGSASSLYGNGSGGVLSFFTDLSSPDPFDQTVRVTSGSFGLAKVAARTSARAGQAVGALSISRTTVDGFRQFSRADTRQGNLALDWGASDATLLAFRASVSETPTALNPGALTEAEYRANRDSAAAINVARDASRAISQNQFSLRATHRGANGSELAAVVYVIKRFVDNPLATSPPGPAVTNVGTYSTLNRWVTGLRIDAGSVICACPGAPRAAAGIDIQRSLDVRRNWRATGGHPSAPKDTLLTNQDESVSSLGPFFSLHWAPLAALNLDAGARWDHLTFAVADHFLGDGADNSGSRDMTATSGHLGASWRVHGAFTPYASWSTAFETPTTTELNAREDGKGGFNPDLGPQRVLTIEAGARGEMGSRFSSSLSLFRAETDDAIIQYLEQNGRAFFRNAGRTRNDGVELGLAARVSEWLSLQAAWTAADYRFVTYRVPNKAMVDTLDGRKQAGVPDRFVRLGASARWGAWALDADHTLASAMWADDRNTLRIEDWGQGVLNLRVSWRGGVGDYTLAPFAAMNNALDQAYVGAVTLNGALGRVRESAPLRNFYAGMELGWRARK